MPRDWYLERNSAPQKLNRCVGEPDVGKLGAGDLRISEYLDCDRKVMELMEMLYVRTDSEL